VIDKKYAIGGRFLNREIRQTREMVLTADNRGWTQI